MRHPSLTRRQRRVLAATLLHAVVLGCTSAALQGLGALAWQHWQDYRRQQAEIRRLNANILAIEHDLRLQQSAWRTTPLGG